jgi:hypothetical protein
MAGLARTQMCRGARSVKSCKTFGIQNARECLIERKIQSYRIPPERRLDGLKAHHTAYAQPFIRRSAADGFRHRLFSHPLPAEQFDTLLRTGATETALSVN